MISFTNPIFSYNPLTNTVTVDTASIDELVEESDMIIVWKPAALAFSSVPVQKTFHFSYSSPANFRYINFDTRGGSSITSLVAKAGSSISWPEEGPVKRGYIFGGWYTDIECADEYVPIDTMPEFSDEVRGITLYAKWNPKPDSIYKVEHYQQSLKNPKYYELEMTDTLTGATDAYTNAEEHAFEGFHLAKPFEQEIIRPDETTVVKIYYDREEYLLQFAITDPAEHYVSPVIHDDVAWRHKYGEIIDVPAPIREGYTLSGWKHAEGVPDLVAGETIATQNANYTAIWTPNVNRVQFGDTARFEMVTTGEKITNPPMSLLRPGYEFAGWYKDASCIIPWNFEKDVVKGPMTLYDKWDMCPIGVAFEAYGGKQENGLSIPNQNVAYRTKLQRPEDPIKENCTFAGWYKDEAFTEEWNFDTDKVTAPTMLYAKWIPNEGYFLLVFDSCGKGIAPYPIAHAKNGSAIATTPQMPQQPEGYRFDAWYRDLTTEDYWNYRWNFGDDEGGYQGTSWNNLPPSAQADIITLYAKWIAK